MWTGSGRLEGQKMRIQRLKLHTATDCRRFLQRVAVSVINGDIDPKAANTLISLVNAVLSSIRIDEQEKKLDEIEKLLEESNVRVH